MFRRPDSPTRFDASELSNASRGTSRVVTMRGSDNADSNYLSSASFAYNPFDVGLKSTQQLRIDWSAFENHTFFNSAVAKVNVAFDRIINGYPFDGSRQELEKYLDDLTGYEKYVLDSFPKSVGYLFFSGSSWIPVTDNQGSSFPEISRNRSGDSVLDPADGSYTVEFYLYLPPESAGTQVIYQKKLSGLNVGVTAYVKSGSSASTAEVAMAMFSGSLGIVASASISRNRFTHVAGVYDREDSGKINFYIDGQLSATSTSTAIFDSIATAGASARIGSGSAFTAGGVSVTPDKTLSGALDELRVFSSARNSEQVKKYMTRNVFAQDDLILYFKFNEPTGSLTGDSTTTGVNSIVLDSSGNGLHSNITNFAFALRSTGSVAAPVSNEKLDLNPVLFPGFDSTQALNSDMLVTASLYDDDNPNLITRLVPKHYLVAGQDQDGLSTEQGPIADDYSGSSIPGSGELGGTQMFLGILYTWAKFFDELKLFVDAFASAHYVDYDEDNTAPDAFLSMAMKQLGIKMPNLFSDAAFAQYKDGEDINASRSQNAYSLHNVQSQIMRRVLTNMGDIIRSKGTLHSIESFFRSIGIDPKNSFKIKEFGGPTRRALGVAREERVEPLQFINFVSGGLLKSGYLSSSRSEVGTPSPGGTMSFTGLFPPHGVSNSASDGLWTSGSWTYEGLYKFPAGIPHVTSQSLCRFSVTGTTAPTERLLVNLVAISGSDAKVVLYARPSSGSNTVDHPVLTASMNVDIFDGDPWYISFGRWRNDMTASIASASYFVRAGKQNFGNLLIATSTAEYLLESKNTSTNLWQTFVTTANMSGAFFQIGSGTVSTSTNEFLNDPLVNSQARETRFDGQVSQVRFWSKALEETEWLEHARNPKSLGVRTPGSNFNFLSNISGSWQRLRVDASMQQTLTASDSSGRIRVFDYSQNEQHLSGTAFPLTSSIVRPTVVGYTHISPSFDGAVSSDKVRVRGYASASRLVGSPWAQLGPVYEVSKSEEPQDDPRLSIEFSLVDALNRDIVTMFSTMDEIDSILGEPGAEFSSEYQGLEHLKEVYFRRLSDKLNFKAFMEFYRWFDTSVAYFVEHLIPRKTVFFGTNFVIEPHALERHRKRYFHYEMYLAQEKRLLLNDRIFLAQVAGTMRKF